MMFKKNKKAPTVAVGAFLFGGRFKQPSPL